MTDAARGRSAPVAMPDWARLWPLLDELLDAPPAQRQARLAELAAADAALAAELHALLERDAQLQRQAFLEQPALTLAATGSAASRTATVPGQVLGAYTLQREIGRGGMGSVWLARRTDGRFDGLVAIKLLHTDRFGGGRGERFEREGRILARLDHRHIARLLDAGVSADGHQPYLVLEHVQGQQIDRHCEQRALTVAQRVALMLDVIDAVSHAHNRLILHRDLKPSNILVTDAGEAKLLDFGIAKLLDAEQTGADDALTQRAGAAFTPRYAAPEQVQGGDVTPATDVYALGVLLYGLLTGEHPTADAAAPPVEQLRALVEREPPPMSAAVARQRGDERARRARALRGDLDNIVARALKKRPAERYANAGELADDLRRSQRHEPIRARPDAWSYRVGKFARRYRTGLSAAAVAVAALGIGAVLAWTQAREAQAQRVQAEGLIEFMLGDLKARLQPVGRLDALDAVGTRALDYYATQDGRRLDADALGRRARALHLIGELAEQRGQMDEAARRFEQAAASTAELLQRSPQDPQRLYDHAQSEYWVGFIARRRGKPDEAEAAFTRYLALARRLPADRADQPGWAVEAAYAEQNLGVMQLETGRPQQALRSLQTAREVLQRHLHAQPALAVDLARNLGWLTRAHETLGDYAAAMDSQRERLAVLRTLPANHRQAQDLIAQGHNELARLLLWSGQAALALAEAAQAVAGYTALAAVDASNADVQVKVAAALLYQAEIELALGRRPDAAPRLARAAQLMAALGAARASKAFWRITVSGRLALLQSLAADGAAARGDLRAHAPLVAFVADARRYESEGRRLGEEERRVAASAELRLGDLLAAAARPGEAEQAWLHAATLLQDQAARGDRAAVAGLAHARLRLGDGAAASRLAETLRAGPYRHPSWADLQLRLAQGRRAATPAPGS